MLAGVCRGVVVIDGESGGRTSERHVAKHAID